MVKKIKPKIQTKFSFTAELWKYSGPAGWCFVTVPKLTAKRVRESHQSMEEGWGRLKVKAQIGESQWETSIWFDTKAGSYLLPIKALIRKKENLAIGKKHKVELELQLDPWRHLQDKN